MIATAPSYNHTEKADFLYFEVEDPNEISIIMFRESSVTSSAEIRKKNQGAFLSRPNKPNASK